MILHVVLSDELFTAYNNNSGYEDNEQYIKCLEDITNWQKHLFSSSHKKSDWLHETRILHLLDMAKEDFYILEDKYGE